jgi:hypothetical protein
LGLCSSLVSLTEGLSILLVFEESILFIHWFFTLLFQFSFHYFLPKSSLFISIH